MGLGDVEKIGLQLLKLHSFVNNEYVYIRIPKTGSTSMNMSLWNATRDAHLQRKIENVNLWFQAPGKESSLGGWWDHYSSSFCESLIGKESWNNTFSFAMVRNPFSRLYSFWKYEESETSNFKQWLMSGAKWSNRQEHHDVVYPDNHLLSQKSWLVDKSGKINVNFIFRLEEMELTGGPALKSKLGNHFNLYTDRLNETTRVNEYKEKYDNEMIDFVNERCKEDIEMFDYNFDNIGKEMLYYWNGIPRQL